MKKATGSIRRLWHRFWHTCSDPDWRCQLCGKHDHIAAGNVVRCFDCNIALMWYAITEKREAAFKDMGEKHGIH